MLRFFMINPPIMTVIFSERYDNHCGFAPDCWRAKPCPTAETTPRTWTDEGVLHAGARPCNALAAERIHLRTQRPSMSASRSQTREHPVWPATQASAVEQAHPKSLKRPR